MNGNYYVNELRECLTESALKPFDEQGFNKIRNSIDEFISEGVIESDHPLSKLMIDDIIECERSNFILIRIQKNWMLVASDY